MYMYVVIQVFFGTAWVISISFVQGWKTIVIYEVFFLIITEYNRAKSTKQGPNAEQVPPKSLWQLAN